MVINAMEKNKTRMKETGFLVGEEVGVLTILYGLVGRRFANATLEERPEWAKGASFSGISKCKDLEAEAFLFYLKSIRRSVWLEPSK